MSHQEHHGPDIELIARICHETNRAWCEAHGDDSQKSWGDAEDWQRQSAISGVRFALDNPDATPESQHDEWSRSKLVDGWTYGLVKDATAKTHPCLVEYDRLPEMQRKKDALFQAIVKALA